MLKNNTIVKFSQLYAYLRDMFISFSFGNFRSFRDLQSFSMEAAPMRSNDGGLDEGNVFHSAGIRLIRTKAIMGANASGKSNLIQAVSAFQTMVERSVAQEGIPADIWEDRFQLVTDWEDKPVFFQYIFSIDDSVYRYGFQILDANISYEWLYSGIAKVEEELFMRTPEGLNVNDKFFSTPDTYPKEVDKENELYRKDSLFLTAAALNGNRLLRELRNEMRGIISIDGVNDTFAVQYAIKNFVSGSKEKRKALLDLIKAADTGIEGLSMEELPEQATDPHIKRTAAERDERRVFSLFSTHSVYNWDGKRVSSKVVPFAQWESEGTGKLLGIGAVMLDALVQGRPLLIDEFDARFHPNLTLKIVRLFNDPKINKNNSQLIFVTHDSGLLKRAKLRRDQICIVNKDKYGISTPATLIQFKGVRKDASYEKEYLNGTYTGIPYLDKIDRIVNLNVTNGLQETE